MHVNQLLIQRTVSMGKLNDIISIKASKSPAGDGERRGTIATLSLIDNSTNVHTCVG